MVKYYCGIEKEAVNLLLFLCLFKGYLFNNLIAVNCILTMNFFQKFILSNINLSVIIRI